MKNPLSKAIFSKKGHLGGYTLLFSVLTAVLVLGVAVFILGVAKKQYILSATAKDSMIAFYDADSGVECAVKARVDNLDLATLTASDITCAGITPIARDLASSIGIESPPSILQSGAISAPENNPGKYYVYFPLHSSNDCVLVRIWRGLSKNGGATLNVVNSRGYNQCDASGPLSGLRTVERAMQFKLQ